MAAPEDPGVAIGLCTPVTGCGGGESTSAGAGHRVPPRTGRAAVPAARRRPGHRRVLHTTHPSCVRCACRGVGDRGPRPSRPGPVTRSGPRQFRGLLIHDPVSGRTRTGRPRRGVGERQREQRPDRLHPGQALRQRHRQRGRHDQPDDHDDRGENGGLQQDPDEVRGQQRGEVRSADRPRRVADDVGAAGGQEHRLERREHDEDPEPGRRRHRERQGRTRLPDVTADVAAAARVIRRWCGPEARPIVESPATGPPRFRRARAGAAG